MMATLIELMIVVAIIAILAAIAIPLYLNYTAQAEGSEALSLSSAAQTDIVAYYSQNGAWPTDNFAAGAAAPISINGKYVLKVGIGTDGSGVNGVITATFRSTTGVATPLWGATITLSPYSTGGSIVWTCKVKDNTMYKYVPTTCRRSRYQLSIHICR